MINNSISAPTVALIMAATIPEPRKMPSCGSSQLPMKAPTISMIRSPMMPNPVPRTNVIYEQNEKRNFLKLNLLALVFTLAGFAAFPLAIAAIVVLPLILSPIGLGGLTETLMWIARWPALLLVLLIGVAIL